ncbi:MAG: hypothetical protein IKA81_05000 [Alistipes sp.]|nr:hypothetical protein [Alistipes sp.]
MKKFLSMLVAFATVFTFVACDNGQEQPIEPAGKLATPTVEVVETTETGFTIQWGAIENADSYSVILKGDIINVEETSYSFEGLNAGDYTVRVKAVAAEGSGYEDSEYATAVATVSGLTSADWFTQTLFTSTSEEDGYYPSNSLFFTWKGVGITSIEYGIWDKAQLEGATVADIRANLANFGQDEADVLAEINSEEGATYVFDGLTGGTTYVMYALVTNEQGLEYLASSECTTEIAEGSENAKKWLGNWEMTSHESIYFGEENGKPKVSFNDKEEKFNVTIVADTTDPNMVVIDGFSALGEGYPACGMVDPETGDMSVMAGISLGYDQEAACYYVWLAYFMIGDTGEGQFFSDFLPIYTFKMDDAGNITCELCEAEAEYNDGTKVPIYAVHTDIYGLNESGNVYFFQDEYRSGMFDMVKVESAPTAKRFVKGAMRKAAKPVVKATAELHSVVYIK